MPTVTFRVTDTEEKLERVLHFLEENQVSFLKEEEEQSKRVAQQKRLLKRYRERPLLTEYGQEMARLRKEFREEFDL